jgi:hypothetical protein
LHIFGIFVLWSGWINFLNIYLLLLVPLPLLVLPAVAGIPAVAGFLAVTGVSSYRNLRCSHHF